MALGTIKEQMKLHLIFTAQESSPDKLLSGSTSDIDLIPLSCIDLGNYSEYFYTGSSQDLNR